MSDDTQQLMQRGLGALQSGDGETAEATFLQVIAAGTEQGAVYLALAFARVNQGNGQGALEAVDRALELEPRNVRALLFKADHLGRLGQERSSLEFYEGALQVASGLRDIPQDVVQGLNRARSISDRYAADYSQYLLDSLAERGFDGQSSRRFAESLDIALGRKPVHYQQPTRYYFPGLPQRTFYDRTEFDWVAQIEEQTEAIRNELSALMADEGNFSPYLEVDSARPHLNDRSNMGSMDWSAHYLWRDGEPLTQNLDRCPATAAALSAVPMPMVAGQTPSALFSRLAPGATIPPHHGVLNTRLICHLPLIVPKDCGALRVGNEQRSWREGELLIFDDSMEHEAWNHSQHDRVVLLFDIWRPELNESERHWVSELLLVVEAYEDR